MSTALVVSGLDDVVAASTRLSHVDGEAGELVIAGYRVDDLAPHASFEEVVHLLWTGELPSHHQLTALRQQLAAARELPAATVALLRAAAASRTGPMDALRMGVASLPLAELSGEGQTSERQTAQRLVGAFPAIVAAWWRLRNGREPVPARGDLGHAASYLWLLTGEEPAAERVRALETYLATVSDHGLNASTFTARVIVSTRSDLGSAVTGAIGALKGPLHGGAPGPALDMVFDVDRALQRRRAAGEHPTIDAVAEEVLRDKLAHGERLMGFGHRIYRVRDPRADVLAAAAARFYRQEGDAGLYALARQVEAAALRLLHEKKPDRRLDTNVEFYTALLLHGLGLPVELFTPTFAIGRVAGWTAHCLEQLRDGRLIRPQSEYVGPRGRRWTQVTGQV